MEIKDKLLSRKSDQRRMIEEALYLREIYEMLLTIPVEWAACFALSFERSRPPLSSIAAYRLLLLCRIHPPSPPSHWRNTARVVETWLKLIFKVFAILLSIPPWNHFTFNHVCGKNASSAAFGQPADDSQYDDDDDDDRNSRVKIERSNGFQPMKWAIIKSDRLIGGRFPLPLKRYRVSHKMLFPIKTK